MPQKVSDGKRLPITHLHCRLFFVCIISQFFYPMYFCLHQVGNYGQKELLQTFDIKGSSVNKVFVNEVTFWHWSWLRKQGRKRVCPYLYPKFLCMTVYRHNMLCTIEELNTERPTLVLYLLSRNLSNHMDRQVRTGDTVLVKSREMSGRCQTLPCGGSGGGRRQKTQYIGPVATVHTVIGAFSKTYYLRKPYVCFASF